MRSALGAFTAEFYLGSGAATSPLDATTHPVSIRRYHAKKGLVLRSGSADDINVSRNYQTMKITDVLRAEHAVFHNLFDHIEVVVPQVKSLAEVKGLALLVEKLHAPHSKTEDDLFIEPLEPYFDQMGQKETFHAEHEHIEGALEKVQQARTLKDAKKILLNAIAASRKHFDKEERIVFPLAERILKAKTLSELGEEWLHRREVGKKW
jgi:hemerythrin-like domain-containing protein